MPNPNNKPNNANKTHPNPKPNPDPDYPYNPRIIYILAIILLPLLLLSGCSPNQPRDGMTFKNTGYGQYKTEPSQERKELLDLLDDYNNKKVSGTFDNTGTAYQPPPKIFSAPRGELNPTPTNTSPTDPNSPITPAGPLYQQPIMNLGNGQLGFPVLGKPRCTSPYGNRTLAGITRMHNGVDFGAPEGTPILAAESGTVSKTLTNVNFNWKAATGNGGYGLYVQIVHDKGFIRTGYAHMSKIHVQRGQKVQKGQVIGLVGNTGRSYGAHLHFEVVDERYQGNQSAKGSQRFVNPLPYLDRSRYGGSCN